MQQTVPMTRVDELAHAVIGAAIAVHRELGPGFLESLYEDALAVELSLQQVPFERQKEIGVVYRGQTIGRHKLDLLVGGKLVVELKTVEALADIHTAQVISYLKATGCCLGLLINFNVPVLKAGIKRVVLSDNSAPWRASRHGG